MLKYFICIVIALVFKQIYCQCFTIESILVDACGNPEGANEMLTIRVDSTLFINNLSAIWPNNSFLGWCSDATLTQQLNATITNPCGFLIEATDTIPKESKLLIVTSTSMDITANSFQNLSDTLYIIYQCAGNTSGHFSNLANSTRTLQIEHFGNCIEIQTVSYLPTSLIGGDGASVFFSEDNNISYYNNGCNAPVNSNFSAWSFPSKICNTYGVMNLNDFIINDSQGSWSGDIENNHFFNPQDKEGFYTITYSISDPNNCFPAIDSSITFEVVSSELFYDTIVACDSVLSKNIWLKHDTSLLFPLTPSNEMLCTDSILRQFYINTANYKVNPSYIKTESGEDIDFTIEGNINHIFSYSNEFDSCSSPCVQNYIPFAKEGIYRFLIEDTISNCSTISTIEVSIEYYSELNVPNIFTPNEDSENDTFKLYTKDIDSIHFKIYDRWGGCVFLGNSVNDEWDGTYNNEKAMQGLYLLKLYAIGLDKQIFDIEQSVRLIR